MRKFLVCLSVVAVGLVAGRASAEDNWIGSWKINAAKSKVGANSMRTQTLTFEATADGLKLTSDSTDAEGKPVHGTYTSKFDGKEVPLGEFSQSEFVSSGDSTIGEFQQSSSKQENVRDDAAAGAV